MPAAVTDCCNALGSEIAWGQKWQICFKLSLYLCAPGNAKVFLAQIHRAEQSFLNRCVTNTGKQQLHLDLKLVDLWPLGGSKNKMDAVEPSPVRL